MDDVPSPSLWALCGPPTARCPCQWAARAWSPHAAAHPPPAKPTCALLLPGGNGHRHCVCCKIQHRICSRHFKTQEPRFWLLSLDLTAQRNGLSVTVLDTACAVHGGRHQLPLPGECQQPAARSPELGRQRHSSMRLATSCSSTQEHLSQNKQIHRAAIFKHQQQYARAAPPAPLPPHGSLTAALSHPHSGAPRDGSLSIPNTRPHSGSGCLLPARDSTRGQERDWSRQQLKDPASCLGNADCPGSPFPRLAPPAAGWDGVQQSHTHQCIARA